MPWQTKRAIKADLVKARRCIVQMHNKAADLAEAHDLEIRQLGRQVAERDERIAQLEATCRDSSDSIRTLLNSLRLLGDPTPVPPHALWPWYAKAGVDLVKRAPG